MDIASTLRSYDGKRVAPFRVVAEAVQDMPRHAIPQPMDLAASEEPALQVGATWVIKYLAERGVVPRGPQAGALLQLLGRRIAPDATLHVLQTLPFIEVATADGPALKGTLLALIKSRRAFVRAWAYNGLGVLAGHNPALRDEVEGLFERAAETETAAVRARIRHARAALVAPPANESWDAFLKGGRVWSTQSNDPGRAKRTLPWPSHV